MENQAPFGRIVLFSFIAFFVVVAAVNIVFIRYALSSHSGLVTEHPYEKGLAYNQLLADAKAEPVLKDSLVYDTHTGVVSWQAKDMQGKALTKAQVTAKFIRPVRSGYDFEITLKESAPGFYEGQPSFPLKGRWQVELTGLWVQIDRQISQQYHKHQMIMVP